MSIRPIAAPGAARLGQPQRREPGRERDLGDRAVDAEERRRAEDHREAEHRPAHARLGARHHERSFHERETYAYTSPHGT